MCSLNVFVIEIPIFFLTVVNETFFATVISGEVVLVCLVTLTQEHGESEEIVLVEGFLMFACINPRLILGSLADCCSSCIYFLRDGSLGIVILTIKRILDCRSNSIILNYTILSCSHLTLIHHQAVIYSIFVWSLYFGITLLVWHTNAPSLFQVASPSYHSQTNSY